MADRLAAAAALVEDLVGERADGWDLAGELPEPVLRELGAAGVLCGQVGPEHGGLGLSSLDGGELTARAGSLCSSVRSVMTSHGMAAWAVRRLGDRDQQRALLPLLTSGRLAAVAFSEPDAGSDLSAIGARVERAGDEVVLTGEKVWVTAAHYADLILVVARDGDDAAVVVVPRSAPGVHVERVPNPVGCRAAGHAGVRLDAVRVPADAVLGGGGQPLPLVVTTALSYGRMSVAWGCAGILRACLRAATAHVAERRQFGRPLIDHQLVARRVAELYVAEQVATRACEHASRRWDAGAPDVVTAAVLAKHVGAGQAAAGAASAVQLLASRGSQDGTVVARAYRDAKLMEIIEGTTEVCQVLLAQHAMTSAR
ncbi:acyl-CoA dehydrogenase family protein [Saccharothrix xinjiangensis]|uniref:Acyl-CoA dehydrogenase family protein n=1 Tax=Saccharothrix xinjiangensis TaxID=204798 RepID=A0ABV9Y564_9PSEU